MNKMRTAILIVCGLTAGWFIADWLMGRKKAEMVGPAGVTMEVDRPSPWPAISTAPIAPGALQNIGCDCLKEPAALKVEWSQKVGDWSYARALGMTLGRLDLRTNIYYTFDGEKYSEMGYQRVGNWWYPIQPNKAESPEPPKAK